jgi:hypothetical protein
VVTSRRWIWFLWANCPQESNQLEKID